MRVAIVGAGRVAAALGGRWSSVGHEVAYLARDPLGDRARAALAASAGASAHPLAPEGLAGADVVVLAVPAAALQETIGALGDLAGRVVVDTSNTFSFPVPEGSASLAEAVASWASGAHVVKAFNSVAAETMANAGAFASAPLMPVAGDDETAKAVVLQLARDAGFDAVDAGGLGNASLLESLALLWGTLAFGPGGLGRGVAFGLLRR